MTQPAKHEEWVTGRAVARDGLDAYIVLIRADDDPARGDIRSLPEALRDRQAKWLRKMKKMPIEEAKAMILDLLGDGKARTFNAISVELWDKTADVLFEEVPFHALWQLVEEESIEHTMSAPIRFRRKEAGVDSNE